LLCLNSRNRFSAIRGSLIRISLISQQQPHHTPIQIVVVNKQNVRLFFFQDSLTSKESQQS